MLLGTVSKLFKSFLNFLDLHFLLYLGTLQPLSNKLDGSTFATESVSLILLEVSNSEELSKLLLLSLELNLSLTLRRESCALNRRFFSLVLSRWTITCALICRYISCALIRRCHTFPLQCPPCSITLTWRELSGDSYSKCFESETPTRNWSLGVHLSDA